MCKKNLYNVVLASLAMSLLLSTSCVEVAPLIDPFTAIDNPLPLSSSISGTPDTTSQAKTTIVGPDIITTGETATFKVVSSDGSASPDTQDLTKYVTLTADAGSFFGSEGTFTAPDNLDQDMTVNLSASVQDPTTLPGAAGNTSAKSGTTLLAIKRITVTGQNLNISPTTLSWDASANGDKTFTIATTADSQIEYTISNIPAWLTVTPTTGAVTKTGGPQTVTVHINNRTAGTQSAVMSILPKIGTRSYSAKTFSVTVVAAAISLSVGNLTFDPGTDTQTFQIWNSGSGTLDYQITSDANWLTVTPAAGQSTGESNKTTVTATVNRTGLTPGTYTATLTTRSTQPGVSNPPVLNVTTTVSGNQAPVANAGADQTVTDTNGNGSEQVTLNGSASTDPNGRIINYYWTEGMTVLSDSASAQSAVTLGVGAHAITLRITDDQNATATDTAVITVNGPPGSLTINPTSGLTSSGNVGGPFSPTSTTYTLSNIGGVSINWTAAKTQTWVTLSKTSGTLAAGANDNVTVSINSNANSLAAGGHSDMVTFTNTTNGSGNTTRPVTLTVGSQAYATSISQYGITWTFDKAYPVGQFVNGDWWVVGPVTVNSVSPAPIFQNVQVEWNNGLPVFAEHWVHGSIVNPEIGKHAYDSRINGFQANRLVTFPLVFQKDQSLVSVESWTDSVSSHDDFLNSGTAYNHGYIKSAAVLTCLNVSPSPDTFRPPYTGSSKPLYTSRTLRRELLPRLVPTDGTLNLVPGMTEETICVQYARIFQRMWLLNVADWSGRLTHPTQNMPNYHEETYSIVSNASVILLCDYPDIDKLLIPFVQVGIDNYYCSLGNAGSADSSSCRWLSIFAGIMLSNDDMKNITYQYRTEWMTYYATEATSLIKSTVVPTGQGWTGATVLWRQDRGTQEHEHLHPSEWYQNPPKGGTRETYRRINSHTWPGMALAARALNAVNYWNHPAFFDYVDRWMTEDDTANLAILLNYGYTYPDRPGAGCSSAFVKNMWTKYRNQY